jgi:hypothetical protein
MIAYDATVSEIRAAAAEVSGNLGVHVTRAWESKGGDPRVSFTLTVEDARGEFGRLSAPDWRTGKQRVIKAACWHAHGLVFEGILRRAPGARIVSCMSSVTSAGGNWEDRNIGSQVAPFLYSKACRCVSGVFMVFGVRP